MRAEQQEHRHSAAEGLCRGPAGTGALEGERMFPLILDLSFPTIKYSSLKRHNLSGDCEV